LFWNAGGKTMSNIVEKFVDENWSKESTQCLNRDRIHGYFRFLKISDNKQDDYFTSGRNHLEDIRNYGESLGHLAQNTRKSYLTTVKIFFEDNGVAIPKRFMHKMYVKNGLKNVRTVIQKRTFSIAQMKHVVDNANYKLKPIILVLTSTGMRIGELLDLKINDIDFEERMIYIKESAAKGGRQRYCFFSEETKLALQDWIKLDRDRSFKNMMNSPIFKRWLEKNYDGDLDRYKSECKNLFPYSKSNVDLMWHGLLDSLGAPYNKKVEQNGREFLVYNIHSMRRFYINNFKVTDDIESDAKYYMAGQFSRLKTVGEAYFDGQLEKLKEIYDKYCHQVTIIEDSRVVENRLTERIDRSENVIEYHTEKLKQKDKQIDKLSKQVTQLMDLLYDEESLKKRANKQLSQ
jgi:integrase